LVKVTLKDETFDERTGSVLHLRVDRIISDSDTVIGFFSID
jgi:hypothetical protein